MTGPVTRVLVTAGPTHEPIDAVRYLANRSSGRMGMALAEAAAGRGLSTTLLLGPVPIEPPESSLLLVRRFRTAADLRLLLHTLWPDHDLLLMAAAVADYRPVAAGTGKLRRADAPLRLELEPVPDLLAEVAAASRPDQRLVGFALEPAETLLESAREKIARKGLHAIVANPLGTMDAERVTATILTRDGGTMAPDPDLPKAEFAAWLIERLVGGEP